MRLSVSAFHDVPESSEVFGPCCFGALRGFFVEGKFFWSEVHAQSSAIFGNDRRVEPSTFRRSLLIHVLREPFFGSAGRFAHVEHATAGIRLRCRFQFDDVHGPHAGVAIDGEALAPEMTLRVDSQCLAIRTGDGSKGDGQVQAE